MRSIYVGRVLEDSARPHRLEAGMMGKKKKIKDESKEREEGGMRWERKMDKRKRNSILEGSFET